MKRSSSKNNKLEKQAHPKAELFGGVSNLREGVAQRVRGVGGDDEGGVAVVGEAHGQRRRAARLPDPTLSPEHVVPPPRPGRHLLEPQLLRPLLRGRGGLRRSRRRRRAQPCGTSRAPPREAYDAAGLRRQREAARGGVEARRGGREHRGERGTRADCLGFASLRFASLLATSLLRSRSRSTAEHQPA